MMMMMNSDKVIKLDSRETALGSQAMYKRKQDVFTK